MTTQNNTANRLAIFVLAALCLASPLFAGPVAIAGSDQITSVGQNVTLNGASSTCSGCSIVSYSWNFGDNETASGVSAIHTYSSASSYTATLTILANDSTASSDTLTITVQSSDSTPPVITHTNVSAWTQNSSMPVSATITDNVGVLSALLYYKNSTDSSFSSTSMTANGNLYSGTIPQSATLGENLTYYIHATDTSSITADYPSGGSSAAVFTALSGTDTVPPITSLVSVGSDTSTPYWATTSGYAEVAVSGEEAMLCRMGQSNSNYSSYTVGYVDCTISGSIATCNETLSDGNYTRYASCKDSGGNEQNTTQTLNVSFGLDSTAPAAISDLAATEALSRITLAWTATTDATSGVSVQKIYRSADCTGNYTSIASASANATGYNDTSSLVSGTSYCYVAYGLDNAGNAQGSGTATSAIRFGAPAVSGMAMALSGSTLTLYANTTKSANCRYANSSLGYASMSVDFVTGQGGTTHSTNLSETSGNVTYYVSCTDLLGNNMTTANSTNYTFATTTTTTTTATAASTGSGSSGGGNVGAGSGSPPAASGVTVNIGETTVLETRTVAFDAGKSVFTLKLVNSGNKSTGPITVREHIPEKVANSTDQLSFSFQPTRFESGSIIAVWDIAGIGVGESFSISYTVAKKVYSTTGFDMSITPYAAPTTQPPVQQPATQPTPEEKKPVAKPSETPSGAGTQGAQENETGAGTPAAQPDAGLFGALFAFGGIVLGMAVIAVAAFLLLFFLLKIRKKKRL